MSTLEKSIMAIITMSKDKVGGGAPIFVVDTEEEVQRTARLFESVLGGMLHKVNETTYVVVRH